MSAACKSCGAPIIWAKTAKGKAMPLDDTPTPAGTFILLEANALTNDLSAVTAPKEYDGKRPRPRYTSHFATCPQAHQHRRAGA